MTQMAADKFVWLVMEAGWNGDAIHAVYGDSATANKSVRAIKAEAAKQRVDPDSKHDLEMNLYVSKRLVRPAGDLLRLDEVTARRGGF